MWNGWWLPRYFQIFFQMERNLWLKLSLLEVYPQVKGDATKVYLWVHLLLPQVATDWQEWIKWAMWKQSVLSTIHCWKVNGSPGSAVSWLQDISSGIVCRAYRVKCRRIKVRLLSSIFLCLRLKGAVAKKMANVDILEKSQISRNCSFLLWRRSGR